LPSKAGSHAPRFAKDLAALRQGRHSGTRPCEVRTPNPTALPRLGRESSGRECKGGASKDAASKAPEIREICLTRRTHRARTSFPVGEVTLTGDRHHRLSMTPLPEYFLMRVAPVSQTTQSHLLAKARGVTEPKGAVLFRRGEPAFGIFLLRKGSLSLRLESGEGKVLVDRTATPDSIIGLPSTLSGGRYSLTAVTLEESDLALVDRAALIELLKSDPSIGLELMRALGDEVLQMRAILASTPTAVLKDSSVLPLTEA